jgi:hypothetical protein
VQLSLPGADPQVLTAGDAGGAGDAGADAEGNGVPLGAGADDDEEQEAGGQDADSASPRRQGLVASGAQDDLN